MLLDETKEMGRTCNSQYKLMTKGKYDGKVNNGKSHIKLPWTRKIWKKDKDRQFRQLTATFVTWTIKVTHGGTILTTLALQFLPSYLFWRRNNGFFQQSTLTPPCPTLSFSLLLSSSSPSSECKISNHGVWSWAEGELIITEKWTGEREWVKR